MDLEERTIEGLQERCEECGARLTEREMTAAIESGKGFFCSRCASERVEIDAEEGEESL